MNYVTMIFASLLITENLGAVAENSAPQQVGLAQRVLQFILPKKQVQVATQQPSATKTEQKPATMVGSLPKIVQLLTEQLKTIVVQERMQHPEQKAAVDKILLYGPPGTGKTAAIDEVARQSGCNIVKLKGPAVVSEYLGSGAKNIRDTFNEAATKAIQTNKPTIVFIDEIDAIAMGNDEKFRSEHQAALQTLWLCMDHPLCKMGIVIPVFATNRDISKFPDAFKNRFSDLNTFEYKNPDYQTRLDVLKFYAAETSLSLDESLLQELAKKSDGMSIRQLEYTIKDCQLTRAIEHTETVDRTTLLKLLAENKRKNSATTGPSLGERYDNSVVKNIQRALTTAGGVDLAYRIGALGARLIGLV